MKPKSRHRGLTLFVTVGTTQFDELVDKVLSEQITEQLVELGFNKVILQVGKSDYSTTHVEALKKKYSLDIEVYDYKNSISDDIDRANVVVGHAGAGTCLEVLRMNKRLLIVVNDSLMDNHQTELADQLSIENFVVQTKVANLSENLDLVCNSDLDKFSAQDASKFEEIFDDALKKVNSRL